MIDGKIMMLILKFIKKINFFQRFFFKKRVKIGDSFSNSIVTKISTSILLGNHFIKNEFCRYDIILRYLTVKSLEEQRFDYIEKYRKMQKERVDRETFYQFASLLESIKKNGFANKYPITVNKNGMIIDGSHRLATALYYNISEVPIKIINSKKNVYYGLKWFKSRFNETDLDNLEKTLNYLFLINGLWFPVILWPTVEQFFDEIVRFVNQKYKVKCYYKLKLEADFSEFVKKIYEADDIESWEIEKQICSLNRFSTYVSVAFIEICSPNYQFNSKSYKPVSKTCELIKKEINNNFKSKVDGFFYDAICHIGYSPDYNKNILKILNKYCDATKTFEQLYRQ